MYLNVKHVIKNSPTVQCGKIIAFLLGCIYILVKMV